jgi:hypothetical protein
MYIVKETHSSVCADGHKPLEAKQLTSALWDAKSCLVPVATVSAVDEVEVLVSTSEKESLKTFTLSEDRPSVVYNDMECLRDNAIH